MNPILEYLKDVIEGKGGLLPWTVWFAEHQDDLKSLLKSGVFLRLKHSPLTEIPRVLADFDVPFTTHGRPSLPLGPLDGSWIDRAWLKERVSPQYKPMYEKVQAGSYLYDQLLYLFELKRNGDELWYFEAPEELWTQHVGSSGLALVRSGQIIHAVVQTMN